MIRLDYSAILNLVRRRYVLCVFCVVYHFSSIGCVPIDRNPNDNHVEGNITKSTVTPPEIFDFMRKFGYLDSSSTTTSEALYHEDAIIAAIKNVQKFGAINETGVLDNATLKLMISPRCGVADIPRNVQQQKTNKHGRREKRFVIGSGGWQKRRITYFIANWSPKVGESNVAVGMERAFALWSKYSNLRFVRVYDPDADIIVAFGAGYHGDRFPFDGPGSVLAHAFYPYEMSNYGGDIHFDNDENWRENASQLSEGVDFQSVAIHELGHSLGLAHSPVFSSIMFPYYKGPKESRDLNYDDIMAMYELYIKNRLNEDQSFNEIETHAPTMPSFSTPKSSRESEYDDYDEPSTTILSVPRTTKHPLRNPVTTSNRWKTDSIATTTSVSWTKSTYDGDYESVEKHKRRFGFTTADIWTTTTTTTTTAKPSTTRPMPPDLCKGQGFDAVALLRGEIFIFKDEFVWRLTEKYRIAPGYPIPFKDIFTQIPDDVRHIDAIYERQTDSSIVLFNGNRYWIFDGYRFIENTPRPITDFGFIENVTKIDAAMVWSKNERTYLFAGSKFIRFDEVNRRMDDNYPANISDKWHDIPNNIDAATCVANGKTYFFKGNLYWLYNNYWIRPEHGYPRRASTIWLGCPLQLRQSRHRQSSLRQRTPNGSQYLRHHQH